jgi:hypothetical protein
MNQRSIIVTVIIALAAIAFADGQPLAPPQVGLAVPRSFSTSVTVKHYRAGEVMMSSPPFSITTAASVTQYHGWFGPRVAEQSDIHGWTVRVYASFNKNVAAAFASAKDGYDAKLDESPEFFGRDDRSYMYARFRRKHFRWGQAVSFLSQGTQDTALYVPHNGHLTYEVWGISADKRYTAVASVAVSHPKLAAWGTGVRDVPSIQALKRDRDYKLIERCKPEEFTPSLTEFDKMLDSLTIR